MARLRAMAVVLAAVVMAGCAGMTKSEMGAYPMSEAVGGALLDQPSPAPARAGEAPPSPLAAVTTGAVADGDLQPSPERPAARLRVYTGYLELVVNEVERARERVIETAGQLGGYVESTTAEYVVVRVPAARLEEAMGIVSELGELRERSIETADVTEAYADLGRRIEIARKTRERLYALLDRTTDVDERVRLLREIRRLTEDIEGMTSALTLLQGQIDLSRLTVRLVGRIEGGGERPPIPFPWIAGLQPLRPSGARARVEIGVRLPDHYAVFESGLKIRAEAADGTRLSIGVVPNQPVGDTAFWRDALRWHLGGLYRSATPLVAGAFEGAIFESKDIEPFHYLVALVRRGDELVVAEAFFPDARAREQDLGDITAALEGWKP